MFVRPPAIVTCTLRDAQINDLPALRSIEAQCFARTASDASWRMMIDQSLAGRIGHALVAVTSEQLIAGYAIGHQSGITLSSLVCVGVRQALRRRTVGMQLVEAFRAKNQPRIKISSIVAQDDLASQLFLRALQFRCSDVWTSRSGVEVMRFDYRVGRERWSYGPRIGAQLATRPLVPPQ